MAVLRMDKCAKTGFEVRLKQHFPTVLVYLNLVRERQYLNDAE